MSLSTGDLHLVLPALNLPILYAGILNGATSNIVHVLLEHCGLPDVPPLAVHLKGQGYHSKTFSLFEFFCGSLS